MSTTEAQTASPDPTVGKVDMKLEIHVVPVSDVDRSKQFYERLGWRLDDDAAPLEGLRIVQFTPPGSGTSVTFGTGTHHGRAGLGRGGLVVSDIEAAHDELVGRGIDVSDMWHGPPFPVEARQPGARSRAHQLRLVLLLHRSRQQHVAGPGGHDAAPRPGRTPPGRDIVSTADLEARFGVPRPPTASTRSAPGARHLLHRRPDEDWPAWYAAYMAAEQAGTDLPT